MILEIYYEINLFFQILFNNNRSISKSFKMVFMNKNLKSDFLNLKIPKSIAQKKFYISLFD